MKLSMGGVAMVLVAMSVGCAPTTARPAKPVEMVSLSPSSLEPATMDDTELHAMIGTTEITSGDPLPTPAAETMALPNERLPVAAVTWATHAE